MLLVEVAEWGREWGRGRETVRVVGGIHYMCSNGVWSYMIVKVCNYDQ